MFDRGSLVAALAIALRAPIRKRPLNAVIAARLAVRDVAANCEFLGNNARCCAARHHQELGGEVG
jgi:hypothetical protein